MCSSLRFRFTISLPPTSPGWRWTKMTRWVLYFQSFISITRIISIFSIHRWSHCPGGSCQSQCDSLWILLRALLRLSRLGPVVWRALRGLRLHAEHTGGKQWFLKTWGKFGTLSGLRAPLGWVELPGKKNLNSIPDLNLLNLLIILPWKYVPTIKCFSSKVLSPVFTVHWGLAKKKGRPTWRERFFFKCVFLIDFFSPRQNSNNRKRFPHFKKELYARFSNLPQFPIFPTIFETNDKNFWFSHPPNILFSKVQPWLCQGVGSGAGGDQGRAREDDEEVQAGEGSSQTNEKSRGLSRKNNCYRNKTAAEESHDSELLCFSEAVRLSTNTKIEATWMLFFFLAASNGQITLNHAFESFVFFSMLYLITNSSIQKEFRGQTLCASSSSLAEFLPKKIVSSHRSWQIADIVHPVVL